MFGYMFVDWMKNSTEITQHKNIDCIIKKHIKTHVPQSYRLRRVKKQSKRNAIQPKTYHTYNETLLA